MIPYPNLPCFLDESLYGYEEPDHPLSSFPSPPTQVGEKKTVVAPVMQTSRKADRHSKICTAQGLRHRRMRLSVKIATKFFSLQDRLGFDKASQTIEWLLTNAHSAIEQLTASNSAKNETMHSGHHSAGSDQITTSDNKKSISLTPPRKRRNISRKGAVDPIVMKDSREKARARARERTREKKKKMMMTMMMMISNRINGG